MLKKLQKILLSIPMISVAGFATFYLVFGFLAVPAIMKWQAEKQAQAQLGHNLQIGVIRFNPLVLRAELDDLTLADANGKVMLGFKQLLLDFELRSVIEGAWTFSSLILDAPFFRIDVNQSGKHNFDTLFQRLSSGDPQAKSGSLPRVVIGKLALTNGWVEYSDRGLAEPLVTRVEPININVAHLSTLPEELAEFQMSARSLGGESLNLSGQIGLNPFASKGQVALQALNIETLARGFSRQIAVDKPHGKMSLNAGFDLAVDDKRELSGLVQSIELSLDALSVHAPGQSLPLATLKAAKLEKGRVNLGSHEVNFSALTLNNGSASLMVDAQGHADWSRIIRTLPTSPQVPPAPATSRWQVAIEKIRLSDIAFQFNDLAMGRRASAAAISADLSLLANISPEGTQLTFNESKATASKIQLDQGHDFLTLPDLLIDTGAVIVDSTQAGLKLSAVASHVAADKGFTAKLGDASFDLQKPRLATSRIELATGKTSISGKIEQPRLTSSGLRMQAPGLTTQLGDVAMQGEQISMQQDSGQLELGLKNLHATLAGLKLTQDTATASIDKLTLKSEKLSISQRTSGLNIRAEKPDLYMAALAANRGSDGIEIASTALGGDAIVMEQSGNKIRFIGDSMLARMTRIAAQHEKDHLSLQDASAQLRAVTASVSAKSSDSDVQIDEGKLSLLSLGIVAQGAASEVARLATGSVSLDSLKVALPDGPVQLTGNGISAALTNVLLLDPADKNELLRVGNMTLAGGAIQLPERVASAQKLTMAKGDAHAWLDKKGGLNLLALFDSKPEAPQTATAPAPAAPLRVSLVSAQLDDFSVDFEDRRESPPLAVALNAIHAQISGLDTGSTTPMRVDLQTKLASGGQAQASGTVRADTGASNLTVQLSGIALAPMQPYLSKFANLRLASGTATTAGQLQYAGASQSDSGLTYTGSLSVNEFLLEELESKRHFLSWTSIASDDVKLTLAPNKLDIGELRVGRPSGRLVIAKDQSVNWTDVLKKRVSDKSPANVKAPTAPGQPDDSGEVTFPVTIARVRISDGMLDFADLSLRPPFGARMHELKGVVTELGTDADASAKVQLDARVDKFGSAKIRGQVSLLHPEKLTDIGLEFRNLEMTSLSPYVAKFAGYSIASGRLALDLQYKVRDGKLLGQNKIVLKQVELGERVDSPGALDLPLELALAVLKDADGVIDIGLPVSGDLNDPQFDYGAVIGKAVGKLLGDIVTAPFRALAALFGSGAQQKLDAIDFEPGYAVIAPPEREKLVAVAKALKQRPNLKLLVPPTYAVQSDTAVLKSILVRTDILQRMGITLAPGEDPGPVDSANPRVCGAVEQAFVQRYAPEVLAELKRRALVRTEGAPTEKLPPAFYQGLIDRLIKEEPAPEILLTRLATERAEAIVRELITAGGAPGARISLGEPFNTSEARDNAVTLHLQLEVAK